MVLDMVEAVRYCVSRFISCSMKYLKLCFWSSNWTNNFFEFVLRKRDKNRELKRTYFTVTLWIGCKIAEVVFAREGNLKPWKFNKKHWTGVVIVVWVNTIIGRVELINIWAYSVNWSILKEQISDQVSPNCSHLVPSRDAGMHYKG